MISMNQPSNEFKFNPRLSTEEGLVAIGGSLTADRLIEAYSLGIFPWPHEGLPMLWFSLDPRGVLDFSELHLPRSFQKFLKKRKLHQDLKIPPEVISHTTSLESFDTKKTGILLPWTVTRDQAFEQVLEECEKQPRKGQQGTWITPEVRSAYFELFNRGHAHSIEVWEDDELIGGIYGVMSKNYFSGESMFHKKDNASKVALYELIQWLKSLGMNWLDIQMVTSVSESFGGKYIPREEFLRRIGV